MQAIVFRWRMPKVLIIPSRILWIYFLWPALTQSLVLKPVLVVLFIHFLSKLGYHPVQSYEEGK